MFGSRWVGISLVVLGTIVAGSAGTAQAQSAHRTRRESNVNRQARIARTIEDTYSHRWEVGAGGGYLRFRSGQYLQRNNEVTFFLSGTYNLSPKLGVVGDVRGGFGSAKIGNTIYNIPNPLIQEFTFMAGPSYRFRAQEKYSVSGFATAGLVLGRFDNGAKGLSSSDIGLWNSTYRPAFSVGANLDYNLFPNLALRVQPNYLGTVFQQTVPGGSVGSIQNNLGVNAGVVYRFGRIGK